MRRKVFVLLLCLVVLALFVARVHEVNAGAENLRVGHTEMGEWLEQKDGYLIDEYLEKNDGYSFCVYGAELMTPNEFLARYSTDGTTSTDSVDADEKTLVVLDMEMKNDGNTEGVLLDYMWFLIPSNNTDYYRVDNDLMAHVEKTFEGGEFIIGNGRSYRQHIAFCGEIPMPYFTGPASSRRRPVVSAESFRLLMTARPVRNYIDVRLG